MGEIEGGVPKNLREPGEIETHEAVSGPHDGVADSVSDRPRAGGSNCPRCGSGMVRCSGCGHEGCLACGFGKTGPKELAEIERMHILRILVGCGGSALRAAKALGIGKTTLYRKLHEYGLFENGGRNG